VTTNAIDGLLARISDQSLREELSAELALLRDIKDFGLVFERHIPENARLAAHPIRRGVSVEDRAHPGTGTWRVRSVSDGNATVVAPDGHEEIRPVEELVVVRSFREPVYPGLQRISTLEEGGDKPFHAVINAENFRAVQALRHAVGGQVDVMYLDPPYNSGNAKDWTYNNDYVDASDRYRHSKWLSFMEKRLALGRELLKADGVMVVTIDENEVSRLGVLLDQLFPEADITLVTIVNNPKGVTRNRLSRVEEYAYFCFFGNAEVVVTRDVLLTPRSDDEALPESRPRWKGLLRSGSNALRTDHWTFFYPIYVDPDSKRIIDAGDPLPLDQEPDFGPREDGAVPVWPVRKNLQLGRWMLKPSSLREWAQRGFVSVGDYDPKRRTWGVSYLTTEHRRQLDAGLLEVRSRDPETGVVDVVYAAADAASRRVKTVWHRSTHDAGVGGTEVISALTGGRTFTYPKSVYAVRDTLAMHTQHRPDALIVDFFGGSGTTTHAAMMLNAEDGGRRRTILVTNNELEAETKATLLKDGLYPGDPTWEEHGIFYRATKPRLEAAVRGVRADNTPVPAALSNADGSRMADGLSENVAFFELEYLDRNDIARGKAFDRIAPLLWLRAGALGDIIEDAGEPFAISEDSGYAVLFDVTAWGRFAQELDTRPEVTAAYVVSDSLAQYQQIRAELPPTVEVSMLYEDYLLSFELNSGARA
jgi:adenine-specific DNA-methyltransferase